MPLTTKELYEAHHGENRVPGFSILKEERGKLFASLIGTGKRVLDIGCRDGALTGYFLTGNSVLGVDVDEVALARARALGISTRVFDAYGNWQELLGEQFDVIVLGEVLEHLFHPEIVLEKAARHLSPDGMLLLSVPNAFSLKNRMRYLFAQKKHTPLEDPTHINHFSAHELRGLLARQFRDVQLKGLGRFTKLAQLSPHFFAFDLVFIAKK